MRMKDIQANGPIQIDVWMENLCDKSERITSILEKTSIRQDPYLILGGLNG